MSDVVAEVPELPEGEERLSRPKRKGGKLKPGEWNGRTIGKATLPAVQELLDAQQLTNGEVARACNLHVSMISRIFSGKQSMSLPTALRIAGFLGVSVNELVSRLPINARKRGEKRVKRNAVKRTE